MGIGAFTKASPGPDALARLSASIPAAALRAARPRGARRSRWIASLPRVDDSVAATGWLARTRVRAHEVDTEIGPRIAAAATEAERRLAVFAIFEHVVAARGGTTGGRGCGGGGGRRRR